MRHHRTGCSRPADLGCYAPALLVLEAALVTQRRGTGAAAPDCSLLVSLGFSCAHVDLASLLPWPVLSMWWERDISPSCIRVFKQLHLDICSFCTFPLCKAVIPLHEPAQACISGNVLLAGFLSPARTLGFNELKGLYFNTALHKRD